MHRLTKLAIGFWLVVLFTTSMAYPVGIGLNTLVVSVNNGYMPAKLITHVKPADRDIVANGKGWTPIAGTRLSFLGDVFVEQDGRSASSIGDYLVSDTSKHISMTAWGITAVLLVAYSVICERRIRYAQG